MAGAFLFSPLFVIIIWMEFLKGERPVFYLKKSLGKGGKEFSAIKFRSMAVNSLQITRFGLVLRQTAMDEFPQLINILKGEMSFVGPRNYGVDRYEKASSNFLQRLRVTPGLTGLAQVFAPKYATNEEVLKWDLEYVRNRNFILDLWLIFISVLVTLKRNWESPNRKI